MKKATKYAVYWGCSWFCLMLSFILYGIAMTLSSSVIPILFFGATGLVSMFLMEKTSFLYAEAKGKIRFLKRWKP